MRPFDDDYDDLDEFEFDSFAATRRLVSERQRQHLKSSGRKRPPKAHKERWADDNWDSSDDYDGYDDYDEFEFDEFSGISIEH